MKRWGVFLAPHIIALVLAIIHSAILAIVRVSEGGWEGGLCLVWNKGQYTHLHK